MKQLFTLVFVVMCSLVSFAQSPSLSFEYTSLEASIYNNPFGDANETSELGDAPTFKYDGDMFTAKYNDGTSMFNDKITRVSKVKSVPQEEGGLLNYYVLEYQDGLFTKYIYCRQVLDKTGQAHTQLTIPTYTDTGMIKNYTLFK